MNEVMTEMEDYLSYMGDILEVAAPRLRVEVARKFWDGFMEPGVLAPLLQLQVRLHALPLACHLIFLSSACSFFLPCFLPVPSCAANTMCMLVLIMSQ
jgi:hypothetical protein